MKQTDGLFEKSVACKSRYIPAQYHRKIADILNSLPDAILCNSEETSVHVIRHKRNYRFISAVTAASLLIVTAGTYLHFRNVAEDNNSNNDPKTTFRVTNVMVTASDQNGNIKEPSVTYQISLSQTDNKTSVSQKNNNTQDHDIAGDPDRKEENCEGVTQITAGKENDNAAAADNKKAQDTGKPSDKKPSAPDKNSAVTDAPVQIIPQVTAPAPILSENEKVNGEEDDFWKGKRGDGIEGIRDNELSGKGKYQEEETPERFTGGNSVGSKPAGLPENIERQEEKIQMEIKRPEKNEEKIPDNQQIYLPHIPEYENKFS